MTLRVSDPHFRLYTLDLDGTFPLPAGRMMFLTPTAACTLSWGNESADLAPYRSAVIPAGLESAEICGSGRVLLSCT